MATVRKLTEEVCAFRDARDWKQFHNVKDMMLSLMLEAAELSEILQWQTGPAIERVCKERREDLEDELSDILYWILLISHDLDIELVEAFRKKLEKNKQKYPVEMARGSNQKYTSIEQE